MARRGKNTTETVMYILLVIALIAVIAYLLNRKCAQNESYKPYTQLTAAEKIAVDNKWKSNSTSAIKNAPSYGKNRQNVNYIKLANGNLGPEYCPAPAKGYMSLGIEPANANVGMCIQCYRAGGTKASCDRPLAQAQHVY